MQGVDQCFPGGSVWRVVAIPADKRKDQHVDHGAGDKSDGPKSDVECQQENSYERRQHEECFRMNAHRLAPSVTSIVVPPSS